MQKPVKSIIASARTLLRRPSEVRLATEDMRLILHQVLEELHSVCQKENNDYFTHDYEITLTYNDTTKGYEFSISDDNICCRSRIAEKQQRCCHSIPGIIPVFLKYQLTTQDEDDDDWYRVDISRLTTFGHDKPYGEVTAAFVGNDWQGRTKPQFKFNCTHDFISDRRWRMMCRIFPTEILDYEDWLPFPGEFTSLVEFMIAQRCLNLVQDNSSHWMEFKAAQAAQLMMQIQQRMLDLKAWLNKDVENKVVLNRGYHYRLNNKQASTPRRRPIVEW